MSYQHSETETIDDHLSDEQLMLSFSHIDGSKNQRAFETLYQRHKGPLFRFIKKSINNEQDAKEIFQDLWFKIIDHKQQYNHQQKFTTWAYTIARRLLIDQFRKMGRSAELSHPEPANETNNLEHNLNQPENEFAAKQMAKILNQCINQLPHLQRQVFVMKHDSGLSIKEISQIVEQPLEQTKSQYRYAVQKIKQALEHMK